MRMDFRARSINTKNGRPSERGVAEAVPREAELSLSLLRGSGKILTAVDRSTAWHRNGTGEAESESFSGPRASTKTEIRSGLDGWGKKWQLRMVFDRHENEKASLELSIY